MVGLDTTFLVQVEVTSHPEHSRARKLLDDLLASGEDLAIAPQVLTEFVHVVSDPRRFEAPLTVGEALGRARLWWSALETIPVYPNERTVDQFLEWMVRHQLGRKRLLDTMLAATFFTNGVTQVMTTNARDFEIFGCFELTL